MRIDYIKIENFKAFETIEWTFNENENFNIIYGINGIGKTSILQALSIAVGSFFLRMSEVEKRNLQDDEVRMAMLMGKLEYQFPVTFSIKGKALNTPFNISRMQQSFSGGLTEKDAKDITKLSQKAVEITQMGRAEVLPVIAYFSSKRLFVNRRTSSKEKRPLGRFIGYFNALNDSSIKNEIDEWLDALQTVVNMHIFNGEVDYIDTGQSLLYNSLSNIFPEKYQVIAYYSSRPDKRYPSGIFFKDMVTQQQVPLSQLSDGYQNIYKLVLEIAWRCYQLNPFLGLNTLLETNGVVLIDEIDLHLHPQFQEQIIGILKNTFPKIQFIVSTHSPLVLASTEAAVFVLNENRLERQEFIYGKDASFLIRNFMDTLDRPKEIQEKIDQYFQLIDAEEGKSETARTLRFALNKIDDKLMAKADVLLKFKEN